jgi:polar amino acid transport system substrate-binding protein
MAAMLFAPHADRVITGWDFVAKGARRLTAYNPQSSDQMRLHAVPWVIGLVLMSTLVFGQEEARRQLVPTGSLRVGLNMGNALTRVVGAEIARELARRLKVEAVFREYPTPGAVTDAVGTGWDIAFIAADPDRAAAIVFTPPYVQLDATYLVRNDSPIQRVADADRDGAKIATGRTSAYTLVMRRELKRAELVFPPEDEAVTGLQNGTIAALAGVRFGLLAIAAKTPGTRVLADNITRAQQAIALPKANSAALDYVTSFLADVKKSGFVAEAIKRTGLAGATVPR